MHRRAGDARERLARCHQGQEGPHHDPGSGRDPGAGPGQPPVRASRLRTGSLVADFTYVRTAGRAFCLHAFVDRRLRRADRRLGVLDRPSTPRSSNAPSRQAATLRARQGNPLQNKTIHHSDAGSQYTSVHFTETLQLHGIDPFDRDRRRRLRQRARRDHYRAIQDRMHPRRLTLPPRTTDRPQQRRGHHRRLGPLVQHQPAHAPPRPTPTRRSRGRLLCTNP